MTNLAKLTNFTWSFFQSCLFLFFSAWSFSDQAILFSSAFTEGADDADDADDADGTEGADDADDAEGAEGAEDCRVISPPGMVRYIIP